MNLTPLFVRVLDTTNAPIYAFIHKLEDEGRITREETAALTAAIGAQSEAVNAIIRDENVRMNLFSNESPT
jgi:hypothetical protein